MTFGLFARRYTQWNAVVFLTAGWLLCGNTAYSNIVTDPCFESADPGATPGTTDVFSSGASIDAGFWLVTAGTVGLDTDNLFVFDGHKSIFLSEGSGADSLTQTLSTIAGQTYDISFWSDADVPNDFSVTFGGLPVTGAPSTIAMHGFPGSGNAGEFVLYSGTATATSTSTDLVFTTMAFPTSASGVTVELDDVSVSPVSSVPEPSGLLTALALTSLLAIAAVRRTQLNKAA